MITERRGSSDKRADLLTMLIDAREDDGHAMSDRQIRDEVLTLLLAGHETTAVALSWAFLLLNENRHVESPLIEEASSVLADRAPSLDDMRKLVFTGQVVDEVLRLYPPAWVFGREAVADDEIRGYVVPAGSVIQISPYVLHRLPGHWSEPLRFDPVRFAPEACEARHNYVYLPFGGGPRLCIGNRFALMEAALVLAMIVPRYRMSRIDRAPVVPQPSVTLRPRGGLPMRIERR